MGAFDAVQRRTLALIATATAFDGLSQGILLLQETIARKALDASNLQITLIGVVMNGTMLLSFFVSYFFSDRSKKGLLIWGYLAGRAVFLLAWKISDAWAFLGFLFLYYALFAVQVPVVNANFQRRLGANRGLAFGISRTALILFSMISSFILGRVLDRDPGSYRAAMSTIAVTGLATYAILFVIESGNAYDPTPRPRLSGLMRNIARIARDREFLGFETVFMIYGVGFMILVPAVPLFLLRDLAMSYGEMSLAQGVVAQVAILAFTPFAGRFFDKIGVWTIAAVSFGFLVLFPGLLLVSWVLGSKHLVYAAYAFYSLGFAGSAVLWNLGSLHFSRESGDAVLYQGFHVSLTGVRGIVGPFIGLLILTVGGVAANFATAAFLCSVASVLSLLRARRVRAGRS